jgi:hypothetical protein
MPRPSRPFNFQFELRLYEGDTRDPSKAIASIPFAHHARWLPAKARAMVMARRLWTLLEYPTAENMQKATEFFSQATIDQMCDLAEEIEAFPKTYGLLVAMLLPAAALPQRTLFEFVRYRPGEQIEGSWQQYEAADVLR